MKKCGVGVIVGVCVDYQPLLTKHFTSRSTRRACRGASRIAWQQKTYKKRKAKEKTTKRHERQIIPCKRIDSMILWLHIDVMVFFICLEMLFPAHFSACCKHSLLGRPVSVLRAAMHSALAIPADSAVQPVGKTCKIYLRRIHLSAQSCSGQRSLAQDGSVLLSLAQTTHKWKTNPSL